MADLGIVNEGATARYTATLTDETGAAINGTALDSLVLTAYVADTGAILNSRNAQNVLNTNGVTIDAAGLLTWTLAPADNAISTTVATMTYERHVGYFLATWASGTKKCPHEMSWLVRNLTKAT